MEIRGEHVWVAGAVIMIALLILVPIAGFVAWLEPNRQYEDTVDGHIENAMTAATPEQMKSEIELAIAGTYELGLEDDDYGAYFRWFRTEDVRVGYQREQLQNITVRLDELIVWQHRMMTHGEGFQEMKDVYNSKLENIRELLVITQSDDSTTPDGVLEDAWFAKEHPFVYLFPMIVVVLLMLLMVWFLIGTTVFL